MKDEWKISSVKHLLSILWTFYNQTKSIYGVMELVFITASNWKASEKSRRRQRRKEVKLNFSEV